MTRQYHSTKFTVLIQTTSLSVSQGITNIIIINERYARIPMQINKRNYSVKPV